MSIQTKSIPETFCRDLARLFMSYRIYPVGNEHVRAAAERAAETILEFGEPVRLTRMGDEVVVEEKVIEPLPPQLQKMMEAFAKVRWESARFQHDMGVAGLLEMMRRLNTGDPGPFQGPGFIAGSLGLHEGSSDAGADLAAGYLTLMPKVQEVLADVRTERRGSWIRAREVVRSLSDHMVSGEDLFSPIKDLKDYDEYTFTHALNVSLIATAIARTMEVPERMVDAIGLGALCHDVGKERIPEEILKKPGRLDEYERSVMDRHPVEGAAKVLSVPGGCSPLVAVIAYEHHMRADGSGYPQFPVPYKPHPVSLMVAVADTFDALRTVRPYQPNAFDAPGALTILVREANHGRLHGVFVSVFARLINLMTPGRWLKLSDDSSAMILAPGDNDALQPLVETANREILDLTMPGSPHIVEVEDRVS